MLASLSPISGPKRAFCSRFALRPLSRAITTRADWTLAVRFGRGTLGGRDRRRRTGGSVDGIAPQAMPVLLAEMTAVLTETAGGATPLTGGGTWRCWRSGPGPIPRPSSRPRAARGHRGHPRRADHRPDDRDHLRQQGPLAPGVPSIRSSACTRIRGWDGRRSMPSFSRRPRACGSLTSNRSGASPKRPSTTPDTPSALPRHRRRHVAPHRRGVLLMGPPESGGRLVASHGIRRLPRPRCGEREECPRHQGTPGLRNCGCSPCRGWPERKGVYSQTRRSDPR